MDDIWFRAPVEIGAMLYFNSQICYVQVCAFQNTVIPKMTKMNVAFDLHYACRITTSRLECLQRWWTPRLGKCPSPMSFTSPSLPRRRHHPSLCQRLTMRWKNKKAIGSRIFLLAGHDVPDWQTPLQSLHKSLKISTVFQMTLMC